MDYSDADLSRAIASSGQRVRRALTQFQGPMQMCHASLFDGRDHAD